MKRFTGHVIVPIVVGFVIYTLFRPRSLYVFEWIDAVGGGPLVESARHAVSGVTLPAWIVYNLPHGLWVYSFTVTMSLIWANTLESVRWLWISSGALLGLGGEVGQAVGFVPGTYDVWDLVFTVAPFLVALRLRSSPRPVHEPSHPLLHRAGSFRASCDRKHGKQQQLGRA